MQISADGVKPLPDKVVAIQQMPELTSVTQLRRFIPHVASTLAPLERLLSSRYGSKCFYLSEEARRAFRSAKEQLAQATLLTHPREDAPSSLVVDASGTAAGAALQQRVDGKWVPLDFFSRRFQARECLGHSREYTMPLKSAMFHPSDVFQSNFRKPNLK
ncbi:hypothetical protein D918_06984 [Trichuris suis]|nr:hypothetical protein D918_06984 [Trichuris suis]